MRRWAYHVVWVIRAVGALAYDLFNIPLSIAEEALRDHDRPEPR